MCCGDSYVLNFITKYIKAYLGVDNNKYYLSLCKKKWKQEVLPKALQSFRQPHSSQFERQATALPDYRNSSVELVLLELVSPP